MRYKILRTDQGSDRFGKDEVIYILPRGADPDQYLVIYPAGLEMELKKLLISGSYSIRTYKGLTSEAVGKVKEILVGKAEKRLERLKSRGTNMFASPRCPSNSRRKNGASIRISTGSIAGCVTPTLDFRDHITGGGLLRRTNMCFILPTRPSTLRPTNPSSFFSSPKTLTIHGYRCLRL